MFSKKIQSLVRDYFTLTSRERNGALILAFLILAEIAWIGINEFLIPPALPENIDSLRFYPEPESLPVSPDVPQRPDRRRVDRAAWQPFDPNQAPDSIWQRFGISGRALATIRNYLAKGGRFNPGDKLSKIYGIGDSLAELVHPYLQLSEVAKPHHREAKRLPQKRLLVDLATADTIALRQLPLVGAGRARMIWKYRERLGGFISQSQLLEVFTIDSTVYETLLPYVTITPGHIRKFNVNSDSIRHPYLPPWRVKVLTAFRNQHGRFADTSHVKQALLMPDSAWSRLAPYVGFE